MAYVFFVRPYFDHDAFMHHPMHVLDAPDFSDELHILTYSYETVVSTLYTAGLGPI